MPAANYNAAVLANGAAGENVMLLTARWDETTPAPACGQFYMLRAWKAEEAPLLSRPISVHRFDREKKEISFLYEVRGTGTQKLAALRPGDTVALTGPSGRGFPVDGTLGGAVALVGGGIGTAPLLQLAAELAAQGVDVDLYAGFRDEPYRCVPFGTHRHGFRPPRPPRLCDGPAGPCEVHRRVYLRAGDHDGKGGQNVSACGRARICEQGGQDGLRRGRVSGLHLQEQKRRRVCLQGWAGV